MPVDIPVWIVRQKHLFAIERNSCGFLFGKQVLRFFKTILRRDPKHAYITGLSTQANPAITGSGRNERPRNNKNPNRVKICADSIDPDLIELFFADTRG